MTFPGQSSPSKFYSDYVKDIQDRIAENASLEFGCIWKEHQRLGGSKSRTLLSDLLSEKINDLTTVRSSSSVHHRLPKLKFPSNWPNMGLSYTSRNSRQAIYLKTLPPDVRCLARQSHPRYSNKSPSRHWRSVFQSRISVRYSRASWLLSSSSES